MISAAFHILSSKFKRVISILLEQDALLSIIASETKMFLETKWESALYSSRYIIVVYIVVAVHLSLRFTSHSVRGYLFRA